MSGTGLPGFVAGIPNGPLPGIGRAIQARLQEVFPLSKFEHGVVPANVNAKEWNKLTVRTPFVGLGWTGASERTEAPAFTGISGWNIFLAVKNERGLSERYFGDRQAPGLLHLAQIAAAAVHGMVARDGDGQKLGSVLVRRISNAHGEMFDENQAIAVIDCDAVTTIALEDVLPAPSDLGMFETLAVGWDFGPANGPAGLEDVAAIPTTMENS